MTRENKTWYLEQRGVLLAQEFLLELGAKFVASLQPVDVGIDYMAFFEKEDNSLHIVAVEVRATERELKGRYIMSLSVLQRLAKLNVPAIIIVVDVKRNEVGFTWAQDAADQFSTLQGSARFGIRSATAEEKEKLKQEIFSR